MKKLVFSSNKWPFLSLDTGNFPASCSCWTHLSREWPSPFVYVEHRQHGEGAIGVLRQAAIANLSKAPKSFQGEKGMLDLGSNARLASVRGFVGIGQWAVPVGTLVGEILRFRSDLPEILSIVFIFFSFLF